MTQSQELTYYQKWYRNKIATDPNWRKKRTKDQVERQRAQRAGLSPTPRSKTSSPQAVSEPPDSIRSTVMLLASGLGRRVKVVEISRSKAVLMVRNSPGTTAPIRTRSTMTKATSIVSATTATTDGTQPTTPTTTRTSRSSIKKEKS